MEDKIKSNKERLEEKAASMYDSPDDESLRMFCVDVASRCAQTDNTEIIAIRAEYLRNYIRFGTPYAPHWI